MRGRLDEYVQAGGLLVVFPGEDTSRPNGPPTSSRVCRCRRSGFPGRQARQAYWASPQNPLTQTMTIEGLNRLLISRLFPIAPAAGSSEKLTAQVLMSTDSGQPFLVVQQGGKGRVFFFAVSAQLDF